MRKLLGWQVVVTCILLGIFIPMFTFLGGFERGGDGRISAAILAFLPVVVVAYILNAGGGVPRKRLLSLVAGFGAVAFGLFAPMGGWVTVVSLALLLFLIMLVGDDLKRGTYFERIPELKWTVFLLALQFSAVSATVAAAAYNLPVLLLAWLLVFGAAFDWGVILAYRSIRSRFPL